MLSTLASGNLYELLEDRFRAAGDRIAFRSA